MTEIPGDDPPVEQPPAKKIPAKKIPAKKAPATAAAPAGPAEKAPAKKAPAKKAPAKKAPAKQAPAKQAPVTPESAADEPSGPAARPAGGSPAAAAARRARKIGGRATGVPRQEQAPEPEATPEPHPELASVFLTKTVSAEPAGTGGPAEPAGQDGEDSELGDPEARTVVVTAVPAWLNWAPAVVLSLGALVLAVLLIVFSHGVWWGPGPQQVPQDRSATYVRNQVLAAAKTCVAATNTYEYTDLDSYESRALSCATGEFAGQLRDTIEQLIKVNAPKLKSSQTAQINRGGIESISLDGKQWTILLFGQLSVTNTENKQPRTDPFAAQVRMDKVNGKWLIGALTTVSSPVS
ncbi:MAG: Mce-associated rane protein [Pseudonocardiales bacterium]|nr:Mce-associated rane protein [Pseudonocardiales bacterium]